MDQTKAIIIGCAGTTLSEKERAFFKREKPFGFILFNRNLETAEQICALVQDLRASIDNPVAPVLIDQEGGRVQRLRPPLADNYPHAWQLGELYQKDADMGLHASWLMSRLHAFDLSKYGINVDCLPVLDVPSPEGHEVIGRRAYSNNPDIVAWMGQAAADGLKAGGVLPVIKHMPGHGRAAVDTHKELPVVQAGIDQLRGLDFPPFHQLKNELMAMTAHVVYAAIDTDNPATTSHKVIKGIIRDEIGFDGLLMSDDVSMQALKGDFKSRTQKLFAAGCDMVLHCGGDMAEMIDVCSQTPILEGKSKLRAQAVLDAFDVPDDLDEKMLRDEFSQIIADFET